MLKCKSGYNLTLSESARLLRLACWQYRILLAKQKNRGALPKVDRWGWTRPRKYSFQWSAHLCRPFSLMVPWSRSVATEQPCQWMQLLCYISKYLDWTVGLLTYYVVCRYAYKDFVQYPWKHKHCDARRASAPSSANQWREDMSLHKLVHWLVPCPPVHSNTGTIPPVGVELSVPKLHHFCQCIEKWLEKGKKSGQPNNQANRRQLHQPFQNRWKVEWGHLVQRVSQHWRRILRACNPHKSVQSKNFCHTFDNKNPSNLHRSRINGLINQSWCPPKVRQIAQRDILRIRTLTVDLWESIFLSFWRV